MKIYSYAFAFVIMFFTSFCFSTGQESCLNTESDGAFKGLILLKNGDKIRSDEILLKYDFVVYRNGRYYFDTIAIEEVNIIRANDGNYALEGTLLGGLAFLVFGVYIDFNVDGGLDNSADAYAALTGIGAGVGLIAGLLTSRQKTVYRCGKMQIGILSKNSFNNDRFYSKFNIINFSYNF